MSSPALALDSVPRRLLPLLLLLLQGTAWGLTFPTSKIAVDHGVGPAGYVFWQTLGAGSVLLLLALIRRRPPRWDRLHLGYYAGCGLVGITLPNMILLIAVAHLPAGLTALIVNTSPLVTFGGFGRIDSSFWSTTQLEATRVDSSAWVAVSKKPTEVNTPSPDSIR